MKAMLAIMLWMNGSPYKAVSVKKVQTPEPGWQVTVVNKVSGCSGTYITNKPLRDPAK